MAAKALSGPRRVAAQACLYTLGLAVVAVPPIAVGLSGSASADALWTALRIAALEAFTLVFCQIVTGAFRPLFARAFRPARLQRFHVATGSTGFALAVSHGTMILIFGISGYRPAAVWIGPSVLTVLVVVILTALNRRRLRRSWRWIHRLNYLIFAAVLVHGMTLGTDLGSRVVLKVCFGVYAAVVAAGFAYRYGSLIRRRRPA